MILVHQRYFARPGLLDQVVQTRIEASRRLAELDVPAGKIWVPAAGIPRTEDQPDVIWECTYPSVDERERVRALQETDPRFHAIRTGQGTQLTRWTREHYRRLEWRS